jgi:hypothetical protein
MWKIWQEGRKEWDRFYTMEEEDFLKRIEDFSQSRHF